MSSWAEEWAAIVRDRAARSCAQAGPRGPPFSSVSAPSLLWSVMPWNWYSVGGTGWCYHADWDVMMRHASIATTHLQPTHLNTRLISRQDPSQDKTHCCRTRSRSHVRCHRRASMLQGSRLGHP